MARNTLLKTHSIRPDSEPDTITVGSLSVDLGNSSGPSLAGSSSIYTGIALSHPDVSKDSAYARLTEANTSIKDLSIFNSPIYQFTSEAIDKTDGTTGVESPEIISDTQQHQLMNLYIDQTKQDSALFNILLQIIKPIILAQTTNTQQVSEDFQQLSRFIRNQIQSRLLGIGGTVLMILTTI